MVGQLVARVRDQLLHLNSASQVLSDFLTVYHVYFTQLGALKNFFLMLISGKSEGSSCKVIYNKWPPHI
jgi:hypothetical protein